MLSTGSRRPVSRGQGFGGLKGCSLELVSCRFRKVTLRHRQPQAAGLVHPSFAWCFGVASHWAPGFWFPEWCFWFPWCFFFPEWCFQFPEGSVVPRVFSVPGLGCFQFPDSGLLFPEWCVGRPWVFSVPGMVFPVSRPEGTAWRCLWFPYGVSSCFFLLLCFSLFVASFLFFPFLISSASASLPVIFVSFPPFLPSPLPFLLLRFL